MTKAMAVKLLKIIHSMAQEASLTHALRHGDFITIKTFNQIRSTAIAEKWIDDDIIPEITDDMLRSDVNRMDMVGVAAGLLWAMLED